MTVLHNNDECTLWKSSGYMEKKTTHVREFSGSIVPHQNELFEINTWLKYCQECLIQKSMFNTEESNNFAM